MIHTISINTDIEIIKNILEIHKQCISKSNSLSYPPQSINQWLSTVTLQNILDQIPISKWVYIEKENKILGFAQYSIEEKTIYQIQILPNQQGKGIGKKIYKYIENDFKKNDIKNISLNSTLNALPFYKSLGFIQKENIQYKLIDKYIEMVYMEKSI